MSSVGERKNAGKLSWRYFPLSLVEPLMEVGAKGALKYPAFNFLKGMKVEDCMDSLKRHLMKFESHEHSDNDEETGLNHMAHCAWNALVICYMIKTRPDLDDRYKGEPNVDK